MSQGLQRFLNVKDPAEPEFMPNPNSRRIEDMKAMADWWRRQNGAQEPEEYY
jgi:hypothetical protein